MVMQTLPLLLRSSVLALLTFLLGQTLSPGVNPSWAEVYRKLPCHFCPGNEACLPHVGTICSSANLPATENNLGKENKLQITIAM